MVACLNFIYMDVCLNFIYRDVCLNFIYIDVCLNFIYRDVCLNFICRILWLFHGCMLFCLQSMYFIRDLACAFMDSFIPFYLCSFFLLLATA